MTPDPAEDHRPARIDGPDLRNILRMVDHECDRLRRLVSDLLCMSRLESGLAVQVAWQPPGHQAA